MNNTNIEFSTGSLTTKLQKLEEYYQFFQRQLRESKLKAAQFRLEVRESLKISPPMGKFLYNVSCIFIPALLLLLLNYTIWSEKLFVL